MKKKALIISISGIVVLVVGLAIGFNLSQQSQDISKQASGPTGQANFHLQVNSTMWMGAGQQILGILNTGSASILGYQIYATFTYTGTQSPFAFQSSTLASLEPAFNCQTLSVNDDQTAKKVTLVVSCFTPITSPPTPYTTNGVDKQVFRISAGSQTPGQATINFDPDNSYATSITDAADILITPSPITITVKTDTFPPAAITDLKYSQVTNNSVKLEWTTPTDEGPISTIPTWNIRYSTSALSEANWNSATNLGNFTGADQFGSAKSQSVSSLNPNTTYYLAIKTTDSLGNVSAISNVVSFTTLNQGRLDIKFQFQGANSDVAGKRVGVELYQNGNQVFTTTPVEVYPSDNTYATSIVPIDAGTYDVYLTGPAHLRKKVPAVTISASNNTQNWPVTPPVLKAGDISGPGGNRDNKVDLLDYSKLVLDYAPGASKTSIADLNFDGKVDLLDYSLMVLNYNPGVSGD